MDNGKSYVTGMGNDRQISDLCKNLGSVNKMGRNADGEEIEEEVAKNYVKGKNTKKKKICRRKK